MARATTLDFPQQLREIAERNVAHARTTYNQFLDVFSQSMTAWTNAALGNVMTERFRIVQDRAVTFAKQNGEACFNCAAELANANNIGEIIAIQNRHAQEQTYAYVLKAQALSKLLWEGTQNLKQT
jgi:hypothetical protein